MHPYFNRWDTCLQPVLLADSLHVFPLALVASATSTGKHALTMHLGGPSPRIQRFPGASRIPKMDGMSPSNHRNKY
jgi:hypothetical protein